MTPLPPRLLSLERREVPVDESGLPADRQGDHFVLTGLALHEEGCYPMMAKTLNAAQRRMLPRSGGHLELRMATDIQLAVQSQG